jgi:hypothetical protein
MSHYVCIVVVNRENKGNVESAVAQALAPFDESLKVEPYDRPCDCIGQAAELRVREITGPMQREAIERFHREHPLPVGGYFELSEESREKRDSIMKTYTAPVKETEQRLLAAERDKDKPDPECEECKGTGTEKSVTRNTRGYWDWFQIGGRWTGMFSGYEPEKDPRNIERCRLCNGTGKRPDMTVADSCNGCQGKGMSVVWPTQFVKHDGDIVPVQHVLDGWNDESGGFAMLTPDGVWHAKGRMGWFGCSTDEMTVVEWRDYQKKILADFPDCLAVVVDLHT